MRLARMLLGAAAAAMLAGCATTAQFRSSMDQFLGKPIAAAEEAFGYGYSVTDLEDGSRAYTWRTLKTGVTPGYESPTYIFSDRTGDHSTSATVYPGTYYPPQVYREMCDFSFITDRSGSIVRWNARGEGCKGQPGGPVLRSGP